MLQIILLALSTVYCSDNLLAQQCNALSCGACVQNGNCGWCQSLQTCLPGNGNGPLETGLCPLENWFNSSCPCNLFSRCSDCNAAGCAYCSNTQTCQSSQTDQSCTRNLNCSCDRNLDRANCVNQDDCEWCGVNNVCQPRNSACFIVAAPTGKGRWHYIIPLIVGWALFAGTLCLLLPLLGILLATCRRRHNYQPTVVPVAQPVAQPVAVPVVPVGTATRVDAVPTSTYTSNLYPNINRSTVQNIS